MHLFLQQQLGFNTPGYLHVPLVNNVDGVKLSKQTGAAAVEPSLASQQLVDSLTHLGQQPDPELANEPVDVVLRWGTEHWNPLQIPAYRAANPEDTGS